VAEACSLDAVLKSAATAVPATMNVNKVNAAQKLRIMAAPSKYLIFVDRRSMPSLERSLNIISTIVEYQVAH
jgi:hypothetical protein